jgi:glycosyltransferase involved in cell wall biosynthesis
MPHHGGTLAERSLGGSESAAIRVSRALARRGHHVTVFSPGHMGGTWDNVTYLPIESAVGYLQSTPHDVTVISRAVELVPVPYATKLKILWCHDLALKRARTAFGQGLWNLDAIYLMSAFQVAQYLETHPGIPPSVFVQTRNGVDIAECPQGVARDPHKLVYGSRPERGLEPCLAVMQELARRGSPFRLHLAGYENPVPHLAGYTASLLEWAARLPNVHVSGPLTQAAWQREIASARAMLYPGPPSHSGFGVFCEISCISAMESMACGTPFVGVPKGAIPETIGDGGALLVGDSGTDCQSALHIQHLADAVTALADDALWTQLHEACLRRAPALSWDGVAEQWEQDWMGRFQRQCGDPRRLDAHLRRTGEWEVLRS